MAPRSSFRSPIPGSALAQYRYQSAGQEHDAKLYLMKRPVRRPLASKRRTTLTLPADSLRHAERIARARRVNLSTVVAEALADGLRMRADAERGEEVLKAYQKAFGRFSDDEMMTLNGIVIEPAADRL